MTVIRNNSISGINSITAQSGALNFYDSTGNTLSIGADVTGGVTVATGATISGSTNTIIASTNGSERVRITSSGLVGIGTDNPNWKTAIHGGSGGTETTLLNLHVPSYDSNTGSILRFSNSTSTSSTFGTAEIRGLRTDFATGYTDLIFTTSNGDSITEKLRIKGGTGNVGIGTDTPNAVLHLYHPTTNTIATLESGDSGAVINLKDPSQRSSVEQNGASLKITSDSDDTFASSDIRLQVDGATKMRVQSTGNIAIDNGNLVFSTSGTGIDFSATSDSSGTMTSELLDDYEEGTFDPIYRGGTTDGTPTYIAQVGRYIKIGQLVHLTIIVSGTISGAAGQLEFGGMPFIPAQDAVGTFQANNAGSYASNVGQYSAYIGSGTNYMSFRGTKTDGTSHDNLSVRNVTYMRASITFRVN